MRRIDLPRIGVGPEPEKELPLQFEEAMERIEDILNQIEPQAVAFAASISFDLNEADTFDVAALTGNVTAITINNPHKGQTWSVIFTQDGTGSRTVLGWPSAVLLADGAFTLTTTADKKDSITFLYDGTNHVEKSRALNM